MNRYWSIFMLSAVLGMYQLHTDSTESSVAEIDVDQMYLEEAILLLGGKASKHSMLQADPEKAAIGQQLITKGQAKRGLFKSKLISPYFNCTDCHNLVNEFQDARNNKPEDRLEHAINKNLPFLPGSTLWGVYNRRAWYNGDYVKKYGDLVKEARSSLSAAVQVCAEYCSAGRKLTDWELDAIMHYFKAQELKIKDLPIDGNSRKNLSKVNQLTEKEKAKLLHVLESSIVRAYPASFLETMPKEQRTYGKGADEENGREIFNRACMHCHENGRVSHLVLNRDVLTGRLLEKHLSDYSDFSLYQIVRHGTYSRPGRNQYMPLFTEEKMSNAQLESLVAYIKSLAKI